jgi:hypothetical protein
MTPEEQARLAAVEAKVAVAATEIAHVEDKLRQIDAKLDALIAIANMGKCYSACNFDPC